jgi:hypothetical protein
VSPTAGGPGAGVRLRQVALVAADLGATADRLRSVLRLTAPYRDPGIEEFGLDNAVFEVGDTFLEVVSPVREGTTAGRYLRRRGGDSGYMAIFQVDDLDAVRDRLPDLGVRVVWQADLADMAGTHLHPRDVPGAIVSLDRPSPPDAWRWAGPRWSGGAPADREPGGITGLTVTSPDPARLAERWAEVLGLSAEGRQVVLDGGRQTVEFTPGEDDAITEVRLTRPGPAGAADAAGVRIHIEEVP